MHIPFADRQRVKDELQRTIPGVVSITIEEHAIIVLIASGNPIPPDRQVQGPGYTLPIHFKRGNVYSLSHPKVIAMAMKAVEEERVESVADNPTCRICKFDVIRPGISIGHRQVTAGTLGAFFYFKEDSKWALLSNNHVIANLNRCNVGDEIVQPGVMDASTVVPRPIARLERWVPLKFLRSLNDPVTPQNVNYVDAAIARPIAGVLKSRNIIDIGFPQGARHPVQGMAVRKSGRTTKTNSGFIVDTDTRLTPDYGGGGMSLYAGFDDCIATGPMIKGGDSGSLLVDSSGNAVGLVFAGSFDENDNPINGYACKIHRVMEALNITVLRQPPPLDPVGDMTTRIAGGLFMGSVGGFVS